MESKKKLSIILVVMCVALIVAVTSIVVVLVASSATSKNVVDVKFTSDRVDCWLQLKAYKYNDTEASTFHWVNEDDNLDFAEILIIDPATESIEYEPQRFEISAEQKRLIIECAFTNVKTNMTVNMVGYPNSYNMKVGYIVQSTKIDDNTLLTGEVTTAESLDTQTVNANSECYVYIVIEIDDLMSSAKYDGTIQFALSRIVS